MTGQSLGSEKIERLVNMAYPSFAMLAGMQLDLFTPLKDGPMSTEQLAVALGVGPAKLEFLLYSLVAANLLTMEKTYSRIQTKPTVSWFGASRNILATGTDPSPPGIAMC